MPRIDPRRTYWAIVGILAAILLITLILAILAGTFTRPQPADVQHEPTTWPTPTAIPTLAGTSEELLNCQRQVSLAMNARQMVGAANVADDRLLEIRWVSLGWPIDNLNDALPGVIMGLDVAQEVWAGGCAVFDRVTVDVYDRREDKQAHRLTVHARVDDLLRWHARELGDKELLERLETIQVTPVR